MLGENTKVRHDAKHDQVYTAIRMYQYLFTSNDPQDAFSDAKQKLLIENRSVFHMDFRGCMMQHIQCV